MRIFAVIPAAGLSRRMGRQKLTLPWKGTTVVEHGLDSLNIPEVFQRVVVCRSDHLELLKILKRYEEVKVLTPDPSPTEMRQSVEAALRWIETTQSPIDEDAWALMPADHPAMTRDVIRTIVARFREYDEKPDILIPTYESRGGHPTMFRWKTVPYVMELPSDQGIKSLFSDPRLNVVRTPMATDKVIQDLDTPQDWENLSGSVSSD